VHDEMSAMIDNTAREWRWLLLKNQSRLGEVNLSAHASRAPRQSVLSEQFDVS